MAGPGREGNPAATGGEGRPRSGVKAVKVGSTLKVTEFAWVRIPESILRLMLMYDVFSSTGHMVRRNLQDKINNEISVIAKLGQVIGDILVQ